MLPPVLASPPIPRWLRYRHKVQRIERANLIGYWPLDELSGAVALDRKGYGTAMNGAYTGVTLGQPGIGDGRPCPLFDGANDFVNIYSAALAAAFNGAEGTLAIWARVSAAGVWTDGASRRIGNLLVDANNRVLINKDTTNNQLAWFYIAGGTTKTIASTALGGLTGWLQLALTWSVSANQMKAYANGVQVGTTQTGLGTWVGALAATGCCIGAVSTAPANVWSGNNAHCALWSKALAQPQIAALAVV